MTIYRFKAFILMLMTTIVFSTVIGASSNGLESGTFQLIHKVGSGDFPTFGLISTTSVTPSSSLTIDIKKENTAYVTCKSQYLNSNVIVYIYCDGQLYNNQNKLVAFDDGSNKCISMNVHNLVKEEDVTEEDCLVQSTNGTFTYDKRTKIVFSPESIFSDEPNKIISMLFTISKPTEVLDRNLKVGSYTCPVRLEFEAES